MYFIFKLRWKASWDLTQAVSKYARGHGKFRGMLGQPWHSESRPSREHRSHEPRLCGGKQNVSKITLWVSGELKVRIQSHKLGQRMEDDVVAPSAGGVV